jgi:hypothetical protein
MRGKNIREKPLSRRAEPHLKICTSFYRGKEDRSHGHLIASSWAAHSISMMSASVADSAKLVSCGCVLTILRRIGYKDPLVKSDRNTVV